MRDGVAMSEKLKNWRIQESQKDNKLDIATFKLIGQKIHTSGPSQGGLNDSMDISLSKLW